MSNPTTRNGKATKLVEINRKCALNPDLVRTWNVLIKAHHDVAEEETVEYYKTNCAKTFKSPKTKEAKERVRR